MINSGHMTKPSLKSAAESFGLNCHALVASPDPNHKQMYNLSRGLYDLTMALKAAFDDLEARLARIEGK